MIFSRMGGILCAAVLAAGVLPAPSARAGAWPLPQGDGLLIIPATASHAEDGFDTAGKKVPRSDYRKYAIAPYAEYGLTRSLTLVGTFAYLRDDTNYYGFHFRQQAISRVEAGLRLSLGDWRGTHFSVQPMLAWHGTGEGDDPYASRRGDMDQELDLVLGRSFKVFGIAGFSDTLIGYRRRPAGRPAQIKTDVTLGFKPWPGMMLLLKSENFTSIARSGSAAIASASAAKLGGSIVQKIAGPVSLEIGAMETVTGRNIVREKALTVGLWVRF